MPRFVELCSSWLIKEGDTPQARQVKMLVAPITNTVLVLLCFMMFMITTTNWSRVALGFAILASLTFIVGSLMGLDSGRVVDSMLLLYVVGIMMSDFLNAAGMYYRVWGFVVLVLDVALVFERHHITTITLPITICYFAVENVEMGFRLGLYELTGAEAGACDCAQPPCATDGIQAGTGFLIGCIVMLGDFNLTRGFATEHHRQLRRVNASIEVAAQVTAALVRYDVDGAEAVITSGKDLPSKLAESLLQLLSNLRSYKAYLPHSCLVADHAPHASYADEDMDDEGIGNVAGEAADVADEVVRLPRVSTDLPRVSTDPYRGSMSSLSSATEAEPIFVSPLKLGFAPSRAKVSLVAGNMLGYLSHNDMADESHTSWMSADVERWCTAVLGAKGVVDLIGGDHRYASFNARQRCGGHVVAAVEALWSWGEGAWSGCVVTGQAVCGDFGTTSMLRFMVLGRVASSLNP
eukprot:Hpha_TRINITY_DN15236_c2_g1::TRINITY_DN15236_c2_g1_i1::g.65441::m.65441